MVGLNIKGIFQPKQSFDWVKQGNFGSRRGSEQMKVMMMRDKECWLPILLCEDKEALWWIQPSFLHLGKSSSLLGAMILKEMEGLKPLAIRQNMIFL